MKDPGLVDVHHHFLPEALAEALWEVGVTDVGPVPEWSTRTALETMDREGIPVAVASISAPGVHFTPPVRPSSRERSG